MKYKYESDGDNSENPPYFAFAKNRRIPTRFGFGFELRHIATVMHQSMTTILMLY